MALRRGQNRGGGVNQQLPSRLALPIKCVVDKEGHLIAVDAAIRRLHASNGGQEGGVLAVPALLGLAKLCFNTGLKLERNVYVADKEHDLQLWVEVEKQDENVLLSIVGWQERQTSTSNRQPFISNISRPIVRTHPQSMQISSAGIILRASRSLLETFGNDFIAADFDKHFELVEEQISLADLFHAPGSIPERLRVKHRSTEIERVSLVDPVKTETGAIAGLHLVFMLPAEGDESSEDPSTNQRPSQSGMGLGKHFANAVRQPLGRILANAETIGSELNGPILEQYSSYAKDIASAAKHLSELVGDLEDLDAIDRPEFKVAREPVELGDIARRVVGLLALKAADHQITLLPPEMDKQCHVVGEFRRVLQIVLNLVGNAIRYSPGGTAIRIDIHPENSSISVEDEGPGIPLEDRERVFTKFERLGRSGDGGSGLGLYISRKLALAMGGELNIESGVTGGARFTLSLPIS